MTDPAPDPVQLPPEPAAPVRRTPPLGLLLRAGVLVAIVVAGILVARFTPLADLFERERLVAALEHLRDAWWSPLALIGLYAVAAPLGLPVSPILLGGGAVFGAVQGTLLNALGLFLGAAASYYVALLLGRDLIVHVVGDRLRKVERAFERHGFWPLVQIRFVPLPFAVVNYGAALAGVKAPLFLLATAVGLAPSTLVHTYFASALVGAGPGEHGELLLEYGGALLALAAVTTLPTLRARRLRRERYAKALATRKDRRGSARPKPS